MVCGDATHKCDRCEYNLFVAMSYKCGRYAYNLLVAIQRTNVINSATNTDTDTTTNARTHTHTHTHAQTHTLTHPHPHQNPSKNIGVLQKVVLAGLAIHNLTTRYLGKRPYIYIYIYISATVPLGTLSVSNPKYVVSSASDLLIF